MNNLKEFFGPFLNQVEEGRNRNNSINNNTIAFASFMFSHRGCRSEQTWTDIDSKNQKLDLIYKNRDGNIMTCRTNELSHVVMIFAPDHIETY